jgi:hypothetical protein
MGYDDDAPDPDEVINQIRQEFGDKIADTLEQGPSSHFTRNNHSIGHDPLDSYGATNRITKLGKVNKQDVSALKNRIKQRDVAEGQEDLDTIKRLIGEGWKGELAGGTAGGIAGSMAGNAIAPGIGGIVGGAIGGTAGGMAGRALGDTVDEEQLNESAPLLAIGARAIMPLLSKVGPTLGRMASTAGKAGSEVAGKAATGIGRGTADVAKSAAQSAAQNAGTIGVGVGAYQAITDVANSLVGGVGEVYHDAKSAAGAIALAIPAPHPGPRRGDGRDGACRHPA